MKYNTINREEKVSPAFFSLLGGSQLIESRRSRGDHFRAPVVEQGRGQPHAALREEERPQLQNSAVR